MDKIILEKNNCRILFVGDCIDLLLEGGHFKHYELNNVDSISADFAIEFTNYALDEINIDLSNNFMSIVCDWKDVESNDFIDVLIMVIMQYILQTKGIFVLHSSAVCRNGTATILWGESGAGKTSIAIRLCQKFGFEFISNDSTLVTLDKEGKLLVIGSLKRNIKLREFSEQFNGKGQFLKQYNDKYESKRIVQPHEIMIEENTVYPLLVDRVFKIKLDKTEKLQYSFVDHYRAKLLLYDELSKVIRGSSTLPVYGKNKEKRLVLNNFDSEYLYKKRTNLIEILVRDYLKCGLRGSLNEICETIAKG
jgi:hypothetical protein